MKMKKIVKVQGFAKKLEGFKVATKEMMGMYAVAMQNGEYRIVVLQDAKNKLSVSISYKNKDIECGVIPVKNQADAIEVVEKLIENHIQPNEEVATEGYVVENGMSLADAMGIKSDYVGINAEQLVGKKIKYTAFYKDGRTNTTTLLVKRTELKMINLDLRVELVCYNEKTGNTSFMKFSEKLNSDRINKWVFVVCEDKKPEPPKFKAENTAIDNNQSHTAKLVVENLSDGDKILDYGCGTGRNMRYIKNNTNASDIVVEGCDIADQLVRNAHKHEELKNKGMNVFEDVNTPKEKYNIALNSHVLNVIPSDEIKQLVVNNIYDALVDGGIALIEVRTKSDVESAKHKVPFGDGWHITKTNTYQETLTKEKMQRLALNAGFEIKEHICKSTRHYMLVQKNTRKVAVA